MAENKTPTQESIKTLELLKKNLTIPQYQRPYKWTEKNVVNLLDDIFEYVIVKNKNYRIGSIILHNDGERDENGEIINNIVDGQQRLTTVSILLKCLDNGFDGLLLKQTFKHKISKNNIVYNFRIIMQWISTKFGADADKIKEFKEQILEKCEFVLFTVYQQDEAFQLFDSQNARGLALEPYDLLKAFHLREMASDTEDERTKCVERWEKSIDNKTLKPILGNHLFRIRKWSKNEWKYNFTKDDIDEFKGISLYQEQKYPYESAMRMLDGFVDNAQNDKFLKNLHIAQSFPFSITMPIINGKRFFEYVDYYIIQREKLFDLDKEDNIKAEKPDFVEFYKKYCFYNKYWRSGDEKVRNLFDNILLAFIDKFGYVEDFENYYQAFYKAAYIIRCNHKRISLETILNSNAKQIFRQINDSVSPDDLKYYQYKSYDVSNDSVQGIDIVKNYISRFDVFLTELAAKLGKQYLVIEGEQKEYKGYLLIPFTFQEKELYFFISSNNLKKITYGFGNKNDYTEIDITNFEEIIKELDLSSNQYWSGYKKVQPNMGKIVEIVNDIQNLLSIFNNNNKGS